MVRASSNLFERLNGRRRALGMTHAALALRSGVSVPTVKRMLGGSAGGGAGGGGGASFAHVAAVAEALGMPLTAEPVDADAMRLAAAREKAERIARLVQGTSALEAQAVDEAEYRRLVERSVHELLAGPPRRLWSA